MEFTHPDYKDVSLKLPDKWTVRMVLHYDSLVEMRNEEGMYIALWAALRSVVAKEDWQCDIPLDTSFLDEDHNKRTRQIIKWACLAGWSARQALDTDEKN